MMQSLYNAMLRVHSSGSGSCVDPEGGQGSDPLKNHKNIGFLSNTGLDPLKNHKATKPAFNVWPAWCFAGGPMMARLYLWYLHPSSCQFEVGPPLTKLSGSRHGVINE